MSKANREGKERARIRAEQLRLEQQRRARRNRTFAVSGVVVGVIIIALVAAFLVNKANQPSGPLVAPAGTVQDTSGGIAAADSMAIPLGDSNAPVKFTVYEDPRCSACGEYESTYQTAYKALIKAGTIEMLIHPVTLIDANNPGTSGSLHAGNAFACAQDAGKFEAYHDVLYANQPQESDDAFSSDTTLINYAKQVSGLDTATFQKCVTSHKYFPWIQQNMSNLIKIDNNQPSTPTFLANGKPWSLPSVSQNETVAQAQAAFTASLDKLAGVNPSAAPSGSSSGTPSAPAGTGSPSATESVSPSSSKS